MSDFTYDLHTHSCLSPCADNDNTPNNIAGMASISEIDILALTDHNTCKNCPAFFEAAERYGIIPIAGMELTTSEDIHIVCLFRDLNSAMRFDEAIGTHRTLIKNRPEIFGEQLILDGEDNVIGNEEFLLPNATDLSVEDVPEIVHSYGGICYPAHIDRDANGIIAILGTFPPTPHFDCVELRNLALSDEYINKYDLAGKIILTGSDAHYLENIGESQGTISIDANKSDKETVIKIFFKKLGEL